MKVTRLWLVELVVGQPPVVTVRPATSSRSAAFASGATYRTTVRALTARAAARRIISRQLLMQTYMTWDGSAEPRDLSVPTSANHGRPGATRRSFRHALRQNGQPQIVILPE